MTRFIVGRSIRAVIILVIASVVIFYGLRVAPGDLELLPNARERLGLDKPLATQYFFFVERLVTGDLGVSFVFGKPIEGLIGDAALNTLKLAGAATLLTYAIAIPLGVLAAWKRNSPLDLGAVLIAVLGMGIPNFFLAILLIELFAVELDWLPVAGDETIKHLILPAVVLAAEAIAINMRMMRSSLLEQLNQDYVRTLRAKGISESRIVWVHAFRNALPPVIALTGVMLRNLLAYTLIVEVIFRWPGLGSQLVDAVRENDFSYAQVLSLLLVLAVIFLNLLADIAHQYVDPRVRAASRG